MTDNHVIIEDWDREVYVIDGEYLPFDTVMEKIERYSIELQVDHVQVPRGSIKAYDLMAVLVQALQKRADETGDTVMSDLTPQLIGLEGRIVRVTDIDGDTRQVRIERTEPKYGVPPRHVEVRMGARNLARVEYEKVEVIA